MSEGRQALRRNWLAIAVSTVVMLFSYFPYASAFAVRDGVAGIDPTLLGIGLTVAPFVFVMLALVSRNPQPKRVLWAMVVLVLLGLGVGLLSPALGASAGFGVGGALTLADPGADDVMKWRLIASGLAVVYIFGLLIVATPAGVFTGALLPLMALGFADEYSSIRTERRRRADLVEG